MTNVGRIIEEEMQQALAKAEKEMRQVPAKAKNEKEQALTQAKREKMRADRAEAMLQQAARESVLKMIRKNYSTEEIASVMSGFSQDDIEAMRKEPTTVCL